MTGHDGELAIRPATVADAAALARLSLELGYPTDPEGLRTRLADLLAAGEHELLVACLGDGAVAGWIHVFVALRVESDRFAELGGLVVTKAFRRRGVGRRLLAAAEAWAAARGVSRLRVRSRLERVDAKAFYRRMGFAESKTQRVLDKQLAPLR